MKPEVKFTKLFIDNEWVDAVSGKTFATVDPATEQEICKLAEGDKADVDKVTRTYEVAHSFVRGCMNLRTPPNL